MILVIAKKLSACVRQKLSEKKTVYDFQTKIKKNISEKKRLHPYRASYCGSHYRHLVERDYNSSH